MKVAIAGYGIEGKANLAYWHDQGHEVTIVDERTELVDAPVGTPTVLGPNAFSDLSQFDLVVRTAGLSPAKLGSARKIWSATNEFFAQCPAPIVGVTGTKGKGTTASLTASILRSSGKTVHLVGNIGVAALEELPAISGEDIVVFELSSFQLWDLEKSPHVSVVLMIEADHLDVHEGMEDYANAKANIRKHQVDGDFCIYHPTNQLSRQIAETPGAGGKIFRYGTEFEGQAYVKENKFFVRDYAVCDTSALQLPGAHNLENACAAISAARVFTTDDIAVERGLSLFTGLNHRLKRVGDIGGVRYYDDSIATTPGSAIAAIDSFTEQKVLILGGRDKGGEYSELITRCKESGTHVLAIGELGPKIAQLCREAGVEVTEVINKNMQEIVQTAAELAPMGSVVILSPAAASFDMFSNYADRGDQFVAAVEALSA